VSGFGGSNLGILSMYARQLLDRYQGTE
jgi:hypothetical protein